MAMLIKTNGEEVEIFPGNNRFTLQEMYSLLGCTCLEVVTLSDGKKMWLDECGKLKWHYVNHKASDLLQEAGGIPGDYIAGPVLITDTDEIQ